MATNRFFNRTISVFAALLVLLCSLMLYSSETGAANTLRYYNYYNATTGVLIDDYYLNPLATQNNTRTVFCDDDRKEDFSKNATVQIYASGVRGTGFVIDTHTIATAAHCVYGKSISHIYFYNAETGNVELDITNPLEYHIPQLYIQEGAGTNQYDYALITVEQDLSEYASCFNIGVPTDAIVENTDLDIYATGFPGVVNGSHNSNTMYTASGKIIDTSDFFPESQLFFDTDVSDGNSGGPVYIVESRNGYTYNTVIGILAGSAEAYNIATRMTTDLLHFFINNPNLHLT